MLKEVIRGFSWSMMLLNAGAMLAAVAAGDIFWTAVHGALAGMVYYQLRTYDIFKR